MASGTIKINTEEVRAIATEIERINGQLKEQLDLSKKQIDNLGNTFFQTYYDVIQQYVTFLRRNVAEGYDQTETANASLSEAFK